MSVKMWHLCVLIQQTKPSATNVFPQTIPTSFAKNQQLPPGPSIDFVGKEPPKTLTRKIQNPEIFRQITSLISSLPWISQGPNPRGPAPHPSAQPARPAAPRHRAAPRAARHRSAEHRPPLRPGRRNGMASREAKLVQGGYMSLPVLIN